MDPRTENEANIGQSASSDQRTEQMQSIWQALETVTDPEIPVVNVVEMGIIADVRLDDDQVVIDMTPTFSGCPALDVIRKDIATAARAAVSNRTVTVNTVYEPPWTSDRLADSARAKLKELGIAPPGKRCGSAQMPNLDLVPCPFCDSLNTRLESIFGPTLCRSIHYCDSCLQSFEHFKPV